MSLKIVISDTLAESLRECGGPTSVFEHLPTAITGWIPETGEVLATERDEPYHWSPLRTAGPHDNLFSDAYISGETDRMRYYLKNVYARDQVRKWAEDNRWEWEPIEGEEPVGRFLGYDYKSVARSGGVLWSKSRMVTDEMARMIVARRSVTGRGRLARVV